MLDNKRWFVIIFILKLPHSYVRTNQQQKVHYKEKRCIPYAIKHNVLKCHILIFHFFRGVLRIYTLICLVFGSCKHPVSPSTNTLYSLPSSSFHAFLKYDIHPNKLEENSKSSICKISNSHPVLTLCLVQTFGTKNIRYF